MIKSVGLIDAGTVVSVDIRESDSAIFVIDGVYYQVRPDCDKEGNFFFQMAIAPPEISDPNGLFIQYSMDRRNFTITEENPIIYTLTAYGPAPVIGAPSDLRFIKGDSIDATRVWVEKSDGMIYVVVGEINGQQLVMPSGYFFDTATGELPQILQPNGFYGDDSEPGFDNASIAIDSYLLSQFKDMGFTEVDIASIYQMIEKHKKLSPGGPNISISFGNLNNGGNSTIYMQTNWDTKHITVDSRYMSEFSLDQVLAALAHELGHTIGPEGERYVRTQYQLKISPILTIVGYRTTGEPIVLNTENHTLVRPDDIIMMAEAINEARTVRFLRSLGWSDERIWEAETITPTYRRGRVLVEKFNVGDFINPFAWMDAVRMSVGGKRRVTGEDFDFVSKVIHGYAFDRITIDSAYQQIKNQFTGGARSNNWQDNNKKLGNLTRGYNPLGTTSKGFPAKSF